MPPLPGDKRRRNADSSLPTLLALMAGLAFSGALVAMASIVIPGVWKLLAVALVLGLVIAVQGWVWGKWLYGVAVRLENRQQTSKDRTAEESQVTD